MNEANKNSIIKIVQELLLADEGQSGINPALIAEKIDLVVMMHPRWVADLDRAAITDELIRRFSIWIGDDISLKSDEGHEPWLDASRKKGWRYWQRYRELIEKDLSWDIADKLDKSTDRIIGLLEDPNRPGNWSRRGLVVGHVQSGKTASYTGLVCKAADAQYKVIIVLAGLHNNLRSQTQIRLDEGFLGYETNSENDVLKRVGVGLIDTDMAINPNCATSRADNGDFGVRAATQSISPEHRPWLFVVKKNKSVLVRLLWWIQRLVADLPIQDMDSCAVLDDRDFPLVRKKVTKLSLLVIDDEADNASVDTGEEVVDETGKPDDEHQPTTINKLIRRILHSFTRSAYVGYTATPFANIFIHERGETKAEGPDIFPSAFIQNLAAPSNYVGPETVFGYPTPEGRKGQLPLVKVVSDFASKDNLSGWMPVRHQNGYVPVWSDKETLPPSLRTAVESFLLACAVRRFRGQGSEHTSMLVHVSRFTSVQGHVKNGVAQYVYSLRQKLSRRIGHKEILARLNALWTDDFLPATNDVRNAKLGDIPSDDPSWEELEEMLPDVLADIEVRIINGTAKDALDYEQNKSKGLKVIAIGGDKLARGLTLYGLCTSYFLRASKMYDTLMQMGRWFGYRPRYLDLCRLYTSGDLVDWFEHISDAAAELREEFDLMANSGATPREFGLKVQSHPELMVTSQIKMRNARPLLLSYSGQLMQTVSFTARDLPKNLDAARQFISGLGRPSESGEIERDFGTVTNAWAGHIWEEVPFEAVVDFLQHYRTARTAHRVNSDVLAEFITMMAKKNELTHWTVAVLGKHSGDDVEVAPGIHVTMVKRNVESDDGNKFAIGVLADPKDETLALTLGQWNSALAETIKTWEKKKEKKSEERPIAPRGPAIRMVRGLGAVDVPGSPEKGLIFLYVVKPPREDMSGVVAFGISFPGSKADVKVEYMINNVGWEQDYGAAE
jgi:hypothetical protein